MKTMLTASLALAVATLGGIPATATGQSAGTDSVTGTASDCVKFVELFPGQIFCTRRPNIDVDVESGAAGENPAGTVFLGSLGETPGGSASVNADATCLSVSGRVAIIGVTGTRSQTGGLFDVPLAGLIRVGDAGGPGSGADTFQFAYRTGDPFDPPLPGPTTCTTFPGTFPRDSFFFPDFTNESGDAVVIDTRPLPATKDQCKRRLGNLWGV